MVFLEELELKPLQAHLILSFFLYCPPQVLQFLQTEGRPSTSKNITIHFIAISVLLWWSEIKPIISAKYNCIVNLEH